MDSDLPMFMVTGVEQGVVALLGTKSSEKLRTLFSHEDLLLGIAALIVLTWSIPKSAPVAGRVSSLMHQVLVTIGLDTLLSAVSLPQDQFTTCFNLLAVFFAGAAVHQEDPCMATQYVLVSRLTDVIQGFQGEALAVAWTVSVIPETLGVTGSLLSLAQLTTVETFMGRVRATLPKETLLPAALLLLYLTAPFVAQFSLLKRMYRFAVFAVTNDQQIHAIPLWLVVVGCWVAWLADPRPTSAARTFAANTAANVGVVAVLDSARFALDNDPVVALLSILIAFQILESPVCPPPDPTKKSAKAADLTHS